MMPATSTIWSRGKWPGHSGSWVAAACLLLLTSLATAATVRDDFSTRQWNNNTGTVNWNGDWIEVDAQSTGPTNGNVWITNGGELRLEDRPNTGGQPSAAREANLTGASIATFNFDWRTTNGVDFSDAVTVEVSANGGGTWTTLEVFTGLVGANSGSRAYDITAFATANTRVRFRVTNLYGGGNESFRLDFVEIDYSAILSGTDLSVTQTDTPDPVSVAAPLSYTLSIANSGPDDATGVLLTDTLPVGVSFLSVTASQGFCAESGGVVSCALGNLISGASAVVNIVVSAPFATGNISNSASVAGNEVDPIPGNNSSNETTVVQNLNVNQLCYLVADSGGGNGGNDLFTRIDTIDFNPATNETNIGTGTGTNSIEAIAFNFATGVVYAANAGRLGTLSTSSGVYQALPQTFGNGSGSAGNVTFSDVDGLSFDATTGILYGTHRRSGNDLLIQINLATGAHVPNAFGANIDYVQVQSIGGNTILDDIAVDPTTGIMYAATNGGGSTDRLIIVNKFTGATTNVAFITVPDIEGLGTDPSGQLWGSSGTQGMLYEINKATGVGSNGRIINNGGDYEAVDCYARSPSVIADLALTKTVDLATPQEGDTVTYNISVSNAGPGPATVVQLMDLLPSGITFITATPSQGTYDAVSGDWFVGTLAVSGGATLQVLADVDSGTGGTTITNTVSVEFLSQSDPNSANDTASVNIDPLGSPLLTLAKTATTLSDPVNGNSSPLAIPGATVRFQIDLSNSGSGATDAGTVMVTDEIPTNLALRVADYDGTTPGPVAFVDGSPLSGLTYSFVALGDPDDDVAFSEDGGADDFTYVPVPDANDVDANITHIRISPQGALLGNSGSGDPTVQIFLLMNVQ